MYFSYYGLNCVSKTICWNPNSSTCEWISLLSRKWGLDRYDQVKERSYWIREGLNSMTSDLIKEGIGTQKDRITQEKMPCDDKGRDRNDSRTYQNTKDHWEPPETRTERGMEKEQALPRSPAGILTTPLFQTSSLHNCEGLHLLF